MALLTLVVGRAAAGETPAPTGGDGLTVVELTKQMTITAVYLQSWLLPGLLCAALYLVLSWPLGRLARRLERQLAPVPA
jgi:hypothetical protein